MDIVGLRLNLEPLTSYLKYLQNSSFKSPEIPRHASIRQMLSLGIGFCGQCEDSNQALVVSWLRLTPLHILIHSIDPFTNNCHCIACTLRIDEIIKLPSISSAPLTASAQDAHNDVNVQSSLFFLSPTRFAVLYTLSNLSAIGRSET